MNICVKHEDLSAKMSLLNSVVGVETLGGGMVKLDSTDGDLLVSAGNGSFEASFRVEASISYGSCVYVDKVKFGAAINQLPKGHELKISLTETLNLQCAKSKFKLQVSDLSSFKHITVDHLKTAQVERQDLLFALLNTLPFASHDNVASPAICGVNFSFGKGFLLAVGVNGHLLGLSKISCSASFPDFTLPAPAAKSFISILKQDSSDFVSVHVGKNSLMIECGNFTCKSVLVAAKFPDWRKILSDIKERSEDFFSIDATLLSSSINRSTVFAHKRGSRAVLLQMSGKSVKIETAEMGDYAYDEIDTTEDLKDRTVKVSGSYLSSILKMISGECLVSFGDGSVESKIYIKPKEYDGRLFVAMPMRS